MGRRSFGFENNGWLTEYGTHIVQAKSAGLYGGDRARIFINDQPVKVADNESGNQRGIHMVVINKDTGKVEKAQAYDTH